MRKSYADQRSGKPFSNFSTNLSSNWNKEFPRDAPESLVTRMCCFVACACQLTLVARDMSPNTSLYCLSCANSPSSRSNHGTARQTVRHVQTQHLTHSNPRTNNQGQPYLARDSKPFHVKFAVKLNNHSSKQLLLSLR